MSIFVKAKTGSDIVQRSVVVYADKVGNVSRLSLDNPGAAAQSGVINNQNVVLDDRFKDYTYYTA